jgi:hypothetical protein
MTRPRHVPHDVVTQALLNLDRTTVIISGVANYDELPPLNGPSWDMEMVAEIFVENEMISLFDENKVIELENPSTSRFREAIADYAHGMSARGDILILYFSGHGCILPGGSFGFCLKDTRVGSEGTGVLPITVVSLEELVGTLAISDVHPVFILDSCFSSVASSQGATVGTPTIEKTLRSSNADTFALLASSSSYSESIDTPNGGAFTQAFYSIILNGLSDAAGKRSPFVTLNQLAAPLQEELSRMGVPLSRCFVGRDFPVLPIAQNSSYRPQSESFTPYMKRIIELLWQDGSPREAQLSEFSKKIGQGAYANHSKLSLEPWSLVEDAGSNRVRRLTSRGRQFVQGRLRIPKTIIRDPFTGDWISASQAEMIRIEDV